MSQDNQRPSRRDMLLGGAAGLAAGSLGGVQMAQAQQPAADNSVIYAAPRLESLQSGSVISDRLD